MQQPRLVQRIRKNGSVTVVLRDPGSTELGKQVIQLNGGPLTARGPQLDLLSRRWAAVNGWPLPPLRVRWRRGRPLRINDLIMIDAEKGRDLCQGLGLDIAASD